jgi:GT2 family glycosyltransferase
MAEISNIGPRAQDQARRARVAADSSPAGNSFQGFRSATSERAGMRISAIIPTKNRPADLRTTVETLLRQTLLPAEVLVVDQSETAQSHNAVARLFAALPGEMRSSARLIYWRDPGISGGAAARNRAMEFASGDVWLFLDDDVELDPQFLERLADAYARCPEASGISGVITNYAPPSLASRLWTAIFCRGLFHDDRQPLYWNANRLASQQPQPVSRLGGGLMSFWAEAIRNVRFDERLTGVCNGEDVDFCFRSGPGASLFIAPGARLIHKRSAIGRSSDHWLRRFSEAQTYLYRRHGNRSLEDRLCFAWLNAGLALAATLGSMRRCSLAPWLAAIEGRRAGLKRRARGFDAPRETCA